MPRTILAWISAGASLLLVILALVWWWSTSAATARLQESIAEAENARNAGRFEEAKQHLQTAREQIGFFGARGDLLGSILYEEAEIEIDAGRPADAETKLREALAIAAKNPDLKRLEVESKLLLGRALVMLGRLDEAYSVSAKALDYLRAYGPADRAALASHWLGDVCLRLELLRDAETYTELAIEHARTNKDTQEGKSILGWREFSLARIRRAAGSYDDAARHFAAALNFFDNGADPPSEKDLDSLLSEYLYVAEVLERKTLVAELEKRCQAIPNFQRMERDPGLNRLSEPNPKITFIVDRQPTDPPIVLLDRRVNLKQIKQKEVEIECEHTSGDIRLDFQVEMLGHEEIGVSTPLGRVFQTIVVTRDLLPAGDKEGKWVRQNEKHFSFRDTFRWTIPSGSTRIRAVFSSAEASEDIRVKLVARGAEKKGTEKKGAEKK